MQGSQKTPKEKAAAQLEGGERVRRGKRRRRRRRRRETGSWVGGTGVGKPGFGREAEEGKARARASV